MTDPWESTGNVLSKQWRICTEEEREKFEAFCWHKHGAAVHFPGEPLTPSKLAIQKYKQIGNQRMVDVDEESSSIHSSYSTLEEERGSPRKKARSVKDQLRDIRSGESPATPKRPGDPEISTPSFGFKSVVTLPNPHTTSTPTRQQATKDPSLTSTPYNRAHTTGRKHLCARCIDLNLFCCWISFNTKQLQAAHLVPRCLEKHKSLGYLRQAIGGRFSVNSRVNYLLLYQSIHTSFDKQGVIVYPTQPYVLDAVEEYLQWLDSQDGGKPWDNQMELVEYFKFLRSSHPLLSDGHLYDIRFTSLIDREAIDFPVYENTPQLVQSPYTQLPTRKVLANPIFLLLNLIHQLEKASTHKFIHLSDPWSKTRQEWEEWIRNSSNLRHLAELQDLDPLTNENHSSVGQLAHALNIAGHLRRRLPEEFQWEPERNDPDDDDSDVFSSISYPRSQDGPSSAQQGPGPGPHSPEDRHTRGRGGSLLGRIVRKAKTGDKRKQAKEQTDCTAIVKAWQDQNSNLSRSWLRRIPSERNAECGPIHDGSRLDSVRNLFTVIVKILSM